MARTMLGLALVAVLVGAFTATVSGIGLLSSQAAFGGREERGEGSWGRRERERAIVCGPRRWQAGAWRARPGLWRTRRRAGQRRPRHRRPGAEGALARRPPPSTAALALPPWTRSWPPPASLSLSPPACFRPATKRGRRPPIPIRPSRVSPGLGGARNRDRDRRLEPSFPGGADAHSPPPPSARASCCGGRRGRARSRIVRPHQARAPSLALCGAEAGVAWPLRAHASGPLLGAPRPANRVVLGFTPSLPADAAAPHPAPRPKPN